MRTIAAVLVVLPLAACSSLGGKDELPKAPPPLADMEEPLALHEEPKDEDARKALPLGAFTGITAADARRALDEPLDGDGSGGVRVQKVIENSPGDVAGVEEDDLLVEASIDGAAPRPLRWPSEWRKVELDAKPGAKIRLVLDRAGAAKTAEVTTVPRVRTPERAAAQRFREEKKVGVIVRTATEVEARAAGLGPGGGAVVVGLAAGSPWRAAGVTYGDLVTRIGGREVAHPQELIATVQDAKPGTRLAAEIVRGGERITMDLPVSRREQQIAKAGIPVLYSYERDRDASETSVLLGLVKHRTTPAAWEWRFLWLFTIAGGDADKLQDVGP